MRKNAAIHRLSDNLERACAERNQADEKVRLAQALIRNELNHHQPNATRLDLSTAPTEDLRAQLAERVGGNHDLFCAICRTPWPCGSIAVLRQLRDVLYGSSEDTAPPRGMPEAHPALVL